VPGPDFAALEREAATNDPPAANRWRDLRPDERARYLADAAAFRAAASRQEVEATRPLTPAEASFLALVRAEQRGRDPWP
jgi:hypothetical protein